jgi:hypothetical protein
METCAIARVRSRLAEYADRHSEVGEPRGARLIKQNVGRGDSPVKDASLMSLGKSLRCAKDRRQRIGQPPVKYRAAEGATRHKLHGHITMPVLLTPRLKDADKGRVRQARRNLDPFKKALF